MQPPLLYPSDSTRLDSTQLNSTRIDSNRAERADDFGLYCNKTRTLSVCEADRHIYIERAHKHTPSLPSIQSSRLNVAVGTYITFTQSPSLTQTIGVSVYLLVCLFVCRLIGKWMTLLMCATSRNNKHFFEKQHCFSTLTILLHSFRFIL